MAELKVENLHVRLGDNEILKGVSMHVDRGEVVALLGPSGSGKTTLLRAVAGLERPHTGRILLKDTAVFDSAGGKETPVEKRNLGLVFQSYALWPHRNVFDNVAYGLKLRGISAAEIRNRVEAVLEQIGLAELAQRYPHQLSGGQQQRAALARALVYNPPVILLDEPLSNLDAKLREEARAWLRELIIKLQLSALCVTHDQVEAMAIADRICLLKEGHIEQEGTPQHMYSEPTTLFAAEFMGSNNRLRGRIGEKRDGKARLEGDGWKLWGHARAERKVGEEATGVIRLESVDLAEGAGENRLPMALAASMYLGNLWEYLFKSQDFSVRAYGDAGLAPGTTRWLAFPPDKLWIF